jgi:imidazole glycerol-phosphate synthase subunit HisF
MLQKRIIPVLLLKDESLVKTVRYKKYQYIGDPANTCRIFNELEVDELCFLDIFASIDRRKPNFKVLNEISNECFMPLSYGGNVSSLNEAEKIYKSGFEKIVFNTASFVNQPLIKEVSRIFGVQAVVVAIDVKKNFWAKCHVYSLHGTKDMGIHPLEWAKQVEDIGAGEILLTNIDREGTWEGLDIDLINLIASNTKLPVIAHGGAGTIYHIVDAFNQGQASAVALGSMVVFQKKGMGVLVNMPERSEIEKILQIK